MDYLEHGERVAYSTAHAAMGVWLGWFAVALRLEELDPY